ncbi:MAG: hypothetical protein LBJ72_02390 [Dysgonamonadaceae bacterium]|jgi:hypothetical protein|nr:hypothetical protein [Dysgonamonadaceae bacterium]
MYSQSNSDYARRGNQAMKEGDFQMAKTIYSESLSNCDDYYSIQKLTEIWRTQPGMQRSLKIVIERCRECLDKLSQSQEQSTAYLSMSLLADYLYEGIGGERDSVRADSLKREAVAIMGSPVIPERGGSAIDSPVYPIMTRNTDTIPPLRFSKKYTLFFTYTFSPTMPVGANVGIFDKFGIMAGFKTSVQKRPNSQYDCNNSIIPNIDTEMYSYDFTRDDKWHSTMFTAQVLCPVITGKLFFSAGGGYGNRSLYNKVNLLDKKTGTQASTVWCHNTQGSYRGIAVEAGVLYKHKHLIVMGGVNSVSFKDFDGYVGVGYSF